MDHLLEKILAFLLITLMLFIIPLQSMFDRQEDVAYTHIYNEVTLFTEEVLDNGMISPQRYLIFAARLEDCGLAFDIELEHKKKLYVPDPDNASGYLAVYEGFYNEDILSDTLFLGSGTDYYLNKGDFFVVEVKNLGTTKAEAMRQVLFMGGKEGSIFLRLGGMVTNESY